MPCGTATACTRCGVTGVGTRGTAARFDGRSLFPDRLWLNTRYSAKSEGGACSRLARESFVVGAGGCWALIAGGRGSAADSAPLPATVRETSILPGLRTSSPSVVSVGADQVKVTVSPLRTA